MKRCKYCSAVLIDGKCPNETCIAFERVEVEHAKKKRTVKAKEAATDERD